MATRWQIFSISESWWLEMKIVRPSLFSERMRSRTCLIPMGSSPEMGSSRNRMSGSCSRARMMLSFCSMPRENSRILLRRKRARSTFSSSASILAAAPGTSKRSANMPRYSRAVIHGHTPRGCFSGTTPILRRRSSRCGRVALAEEPDLPRGGAGDAQQHHDRRGFSRAVGAEKTVDLSAGDAEVDAVDGGEGAVALHQSLGSYHSCPAFTFQEVSMKYRSRPFSASSAAAMAAGSFIAYTPRHQLLELRAGDGERVRARR